MYVYCVFPRTQAADLTPIGQALSRTAAAGLPKDDPHVAEAKELQAKMTKQLDIQVCKS